MDQVARRAWPTVLACGAVAALVACAGSSGSPLLDSQDSGTDAGPGGPDGATPDGSRPGEDAGRDAGLAVKELPAPVCNDLKQRAVAIKPTASLGLPPQPAPITTIAPGLYVATEIVDYNGATPISDATFQTTVFFTATKQYYVNDGPPPSMHQQLTLAWKLASGRLERSVLCSQGTPPADVSYRVGASPDGFTVFIDNVGGGFRTETVRYETLP